MGEGTKLGFWTLGAAFALGLLGDWLLRGIPWGVNFPLFVLAVVLLGCVPVFAGWTTVGRGVWPLLAVALLLSAALVWRASPVLAALNLFGTVLALSLAVARSARTSVLPGSVGRQISAHLETGVASFCGPLPVAVQDIRWSEAAPGGWREPTLAVARGVLLSVPVLLVFGALLAAADALFEDLVSGIFAFDTGRVFGHVTLTLFLFWTLAGALHLALFKRGLIPSVPASRPGWLSLGALECGIVLGSLDVLFLVFVSIQSRYLFGGVSASGMDYSEYARRGFFELVAVAALVVVLLLVLTWLLDARSHAGKLVCDVLAFVMVGLVFVILASALWRMNLYYRVFGLTELRLYTTVFMFWVSAVLVLLLATLPRGRRDLFGSWTLILGFAAIISLNVINPDDLIARTNIARLEDGKRFDAAYLTHLSDDAAPVIYRALPVIGDREISEDYTLRRSLRANQPRDGGDWRSYNVSRAESRALAAGS